MISNKRVYSFLMSLLIAVFISILAFVIAYNISCWLSPPYVMGEEGEKYATMPIGHVMVASIFSFITGIVSFVFVYKQFVKYKLKNNKENVSF